MLYFLKRLGFTVPVMLLISFLAFELMHVAPGGPFDKERAPASPEIKRALEAKFHLNEPVGKQYLRYLGFLWEKSEIAQVLFPDRLVQMKLRLQCAFDLRRCRSAFFVERSSRRDVHQLERQKADEQHHWDREAKTFKEIKH